MRAATTCATLVRIVSDDAPGIEVAGRTAILHRIEQALTELPERQRHHLRTALLEMALRDCEGARRRR